MRTLLAVAIVLGGTIALSQAADAARKYNRSAERSYSAAAATAAGPGGRHTPVGWVSAKRVTQHDVRGCHVGLRPFGPNPTYSSACATRSRIA